MYRNYYPPADWEKIMAFSKEKETPFLVVLLDRVQEKYREFRTHFPAAKIYYAVKANPGVELLAVLRDLGSYFDIASIHELDRMLDLGVTPERLSYGNTIKKAKDIREAYEKGVRFFTSDCEADIRNLAKEAPGSRVFFRLLMDAVTSDSDWPLSRKFGCQPRMAIDLVMLAAHLGLEPYGISFMLARSNAKSRPGTPPSLRRIRCSNGWTKHIFGYKP
jgi:ornithine decarboxylase